MVDDGWQWNDFWRRHAPALICMPAPMYRSGRLVTSVQLQMEASLMIQEQRHVGKSGLALLPSYWCPIVTLWGAHPASPAFTCAPILHVPPDQMHWPS